MKKRMISILSAVAILVCAVCTATVTGADPVKAQLAPRSVIEIADGEVRGIRGPVTGEWLMSQFSGEVSLVSHRGEEIAAEDRVPTGCVISSMGETIGAVTIPGDASMDGKINVSDVSALLKHVAKWEVELSEAAADVTRDGKVNIADASTVLKYIAGWGVDFFDGEVSLPIFEKGVTEYKLLKNDPATDERVLSGLKALTGISLEAVDRVGEGEHFITVGASLHEKYDFIDKAAVGAAGDGAYMDTYDENIYLTSDTEKGLLACINYITYRAFGTRLDMSVTKGYTGVIENTDIEYRDIVSDGATAYSIVMPALSSYTLKDAVETVRGKIAEDFYPKFGVFTDDDGEPAVKGEVDSSYDEILMGETNRRESREVYMELSAGECAVKVTGNKIVILGFKDDLTRLAAEAFANNTVIPDGEGDLALPSDYYMIWSPYDNVTPEKTEVAFEDVTMVGEPIELEAETWVAEEIEFISDTDYTDPVYTMTLDVIFRNKATGTVYKVPAFWDGGKSFKVRFAPTEVGEWQFYTVCSDEANQGLHHRGGIINCSEYSGELDIYKHGFVKTVPGLSYFVYDDGTPFFYLADTHWTLPLEELDGYGSSEDQNKAGITAEIAEEYGITSQFKYIMDYRAEQGYTVIQSQPLGWWTNPGQNSWFADDYGNLYTYGVNELMLEKFKEYDRHFAYIAELGFVHANSQFSSVPALMTEYFAGNITEGELELLCRYWVARYGAYPVMWTTTQEGDNDYYGEDRGDCAATPDNNPWHFVIDYVHKYDPYAHPSTCHQERWDYTNVVNSSFGDKESHTWYAAQYHMDLFREDSGNWQRLRDYYGNTGSKPVVNYEGRYDHFWTGTYGSRAQGWHAYLNGQVGYGYGVQPIWSLFWSWVDIDEFVGEDEDGQFHMDDNWVEGLYADAGRQVTYIKELLERYEWWRLVPCFDGSYFYEPNGTGYSVSSIGNEVYIGYFYGTNEQYRGLGTFMSMKSGEHKVTWLNCVTGEYTEPFTVEIKDGRYTVPQKPGDGDWTIIVEFVG